MATQRRGKDKHLNAGNAEFLDKDILKEVALSKREVEVMEVDHSILAIFEDSTPPSEEKSRVEEENESSLLTALTEMLDSVGDEEGTMSPFDTLPDPEKHRDNSPLRRLLSLAGVPPTREPGCHPTKSTSSVKEESIADRLRKPRFRSPSVIAQQSNGAEEDRNEEEITSPSQALKQPSLKPHRTTSPAETFAHEPESEIEVFTSMSLVNLVKLMHPYCLRLCVEEEGKGWGSEPRPKAAASGTQDKSPSLQGEIWRYEKPSGDSDEEINVDMSDDETLPKETLKESRGEERLLKSALVNREASISQAPKEKKRVSFGPVKVTAFDASVEEEDNLNQPFAGDLTSEITASVPLVCVETPETHACTSAEPLTAPLTTEANSDLAEVTEAPLALPPHSEVKPKPLSLQQYRELRLQRQPLGEKQGNYTTKWPTLPEPPKELSPILCPPKGHRHNTKGQQMTTPSSKPIPDSMETKPSYGRLCGLKRLRTESKIISPVSPSPVSISDCTLRKTSLGKKPTLVNSDPPNPVFLPLPVNHPSKEKTSRQPVSMLFTQSTMESKPQTVFFSNSLLGELQKKCSKQSSEREPSTVEPNLKVLMLDQNPYSDSTKATHLIQETHSTFSRPPQAEERLTSAPTAHHHNMVHTKPLSKCNKPQQKQCILSQFSESKALPKTSQLCTSDLISQPKCPLSTPCSTQPLSPVHAPVTVKESTGAVLCILPHEQLPPPAEISCSVQTPCDSGIEASDLTSLLEQFEETQEVPDLLSAHRPSNENQFCPPQTVVVSVPEPVRIANLPNFSTQDLLGRIQAPAEPGQAHRQLSFRTPSVKLLEILRGQGFSRNPEIIRTVEPLGIVNSQPQSLESLDIPEPLGTDIVLSTAQSKPPPAKTIQIIDPRPLPCKKTHTTSSMSPASQIQTPSPPLTSPVSVYLDHDYCVTGDRPVIGTPPFRKHQIPIPSKNSINLPNGTQLTILDPRTSSPCKRHSTNCESNTGPGPGTNVDRCVQQTSSGQPRTSAEAELPIEATLPYSDGATPRMESSTAINVREDRVKASCPPTPPPSPPGRGRQETRVTRRYRRTSPYSDSSSSSPSSSSCSSLSSSSSSSSCSRSPSPKRKRFRRHRRSESSSSSSSSSASRSPPRHYSFSCPRSSRSRSKSWSRSRSRSLSPQTCGRGWRDVYSPVYHRSSTEHRRHRRQQQIRLQKLKAIDERRVVYVGRLRRTMTHDEMRERFSFFGEVECVSLHFRDRGDNYGFVTFYNMESAFSAIENGSKLRQPDELPFDICFGGRRQFCKSSYADLDSNRDVDPSGPPDKSQNEELDFDSLLKQAQRGLKS